MRFLLRPGWLAFIAVVLGFVVACYALLAPWQFGREAQREAQEAAIAAATATPPVPYAELAPARPEMEWRQVTLAGTYLPEAEALVRLRVVDGRPAMEVLTPLRTADGAVVVVNRGTVSSSDGRTAPAYPAPPAGTVSVVGRLRVDQADPRGRPPLQADDSRQLYAPDSAVLAAVTGLPLAPGYVQLVAGAPGVLDPLPVAPPASGAPFTNLSYALQWLTFGAIAVFALAWFVRLEWLQRSSGQRGRPARRQDRAALRRALAGDDGDGGHTQP